MLLDNQRLWIEEVLLGRVLVTGQGVGRGMAVHKDMVEEVVEEEGAEAEVEVVLGMGRVAGTGLGMEVEEETVVVAEAVEEVVVVEAPE